MPNPFYIRGRAFEYACMNRLRAGGYEVRRSTGSKGPADLVATKQDDGGYLYPRMLFIQCKCSGPLRIAEWNALYDLAHKASGVPLLAMKAKGHGADYMLLKGRRTKKHVPVKNLMQRYDPFGQGTLF